jgi:hypothetical protein
VQAPRKKQKSGTDGQGSKREYIKWALPGNIEKLKVLLHDWVQKSGTWLEGYTQRTFCQH